MHNRRVGGLTGVLLAVLLGWVLYPSDLAAAEPAVAQLRTQITDQEAKLAGLRQRLRQAEEQRHKLELQEFRITQQIVQLGENPTLQARLASVRGELLQAQRQIAGLEQEQSATKGKLAELKGTLRQQEAAPAARNRLGLTVTKMPSDNPKKQGELQGVLVTAVDEGPAASAGIRPGDVILKLNNINVTYTDQFDDMVKQLPTGRPVSVMIMRHNGSFFLALTIPEKG